MANVVELPAFNLASFCRQGDTIAFQSLDTGLLVNTDAMNAASCQFRNRGVEPADYPDPLDKGIPIGNIRMFPVLTEMRS